ncbi:MAG: MBG domain-containing protein [Bacteroidales bacterium]|nr:MBG domain-containing protein [Bacteroidales bacterium]
MNKRILFLTWIMLWLGVASAFAGSNIMKLPDVIAEPGETITVEMEILNDDVFVGFNLDLPLPAGFEYVAGSAQLFRKTDHNLAFSINPSHVAKIIAFSITNAPFSGNDGVILTFDLQVPESPGVYPLQIVDAVIGNTDAQNILTGTIDGSVTIEGEEEPENVMVLYDLMAETGDVVTVELEIMNTDEFVGFNLDIPLPEGFDYVDGTAELFRKTDHNLAFSVNVEDVAKIIAFSITNDAFLGNDGVILSFDLEINAPPGTYTLEILDAIIGNVDAQNILTGTVDATVIVEGEFEPENIMVIHDQTVTAGAVATVELEILNDEEFVGFNLEIPMPEGFTYVEGSAQLFRADDHSYAFNVVEATNTAKIIGFSITNTPFIGNSGLIFSFDVVTPNAPGVYDFVIEDGIIGNVAEENIITGTVDGVFTLEDPGPISENVMIIHDIVADAGDVVTVEVEIVNEAEFVGFNLDIPLPAGFTYIDESAQLFRGDDHNFGINVLPGNVLKIIAFSITNAAFEGNEGTVFSFDLQTSSFPGEYVLPIVDAVIGDADAQNILTGTVDGNVILEGEIITDNIMQIHDISATGGDVVTVEMEIVNFQEFVGFNFDVPLPEGFEYIPGTAQLYRATDHQFVFNVVEETNLAKAIAFSATNAPFTGSEGVIFSFDVQTPPIGGEFPLVILNAVIGNSDAENIITGTFDGLISLIEPEPDPENIMIVHDIMAQAGDVVLIEVEILNNQEFVGFNLDIPLPEGFNYISGTEQLYRSVDHSFVFNVIPETNVAKIIAFSPTNTAFTGNDGVIFNFEVVTSNVPGEYILPIENGIIGNADAENIITGTQFGTVVLSDPDPDPEFDNIMILHDVVDVAGEIITMELEIVNEEEFVGFNLDLPLPAGFEYVEGSAVLYRGDDHDVVFNVLPNNVAKIIAFSITNAPFSGNEGAVLSFELQTPPMPGNYLIPIVDAVIGNADAQDILTGTVDGTVTLLDPGIDYYTLTLIANPAEGGNVTGAGVYQEGEEVEVDALPNEGWEFINWTDLDGNVVSEEAYNIIEMPAEDLTLIANFEMIDYVLTLIANPEEGGEVFGAGTYNFGDPVQINAVPNEGWLFVNWTDEDGNVITDQAFFEGFMPSFDVTLYANFEMGAYMLTLIANPEEGGTVTGAGVYNFGDEVQVDAIPNEGWEFVNWTDTDGNVVSDEAFNIIEMPAQDLTLIANFEMIDYVLTLIANPEEGGTVTGAGVYNFGDEVEVDAIPNEGWAFINWTDEEDNVVSTEPFNIITITGDLTLIANFEMIDYELTLIANPEEGGEVFGAGIYNFGDLVEVDAVPNMGWEFINWTDLDGNVVSNEAYNEITMPSSDLTLIANFEQIGYVLTLLVHPQQGGQVTGAGAYNFEDEVVIEATANTGWEFVNWTGDIEYVDDPASATATVTMPADHVTLTANFQPLGFTLTLLAEPAEGGIVTGEGVYNFGSLVSINAEANPGYTFVNWTDEEGDVFSVLPNFTFSMPAEDVTLTANFTQNIYTLTLFANPPAGGTVSGGGSYAFGDEIDVVAEANPGYEFASWTDNFGNVVSLEAEFVYEMPASNVMLIANFTTQEITVTAEVNPPGAGTIFGLGNGVFSYGAQVGLYAVASPGYVFVNWTEDGVPVSTTQSYVFTALEDRDLVANFTTSLYTIDVLAVPSEGGSISIEVNGEPASLPAQVAYNDVVTLEATPAGGYGFDGWLEGNNIVEPGTVYEFTATRNRTLLALFSPDIITITAAAEPEGDGNVFGAGEYDFGDPVTMVAIPVSGRQFEHWKEDDVIIPGAGAIYGFTAEVDRDLVAHFSTPSYTISALAFPAAGGTITGAGSFAPGDAVTLTADPNAGYTFVNWREGANILGTDPVLSFTASRNRTLIATFSRQSYPVTVATEPAGNVGGIAIGAGTYQHGTQVTVSALNNLGFDFVEWTEGGVQVSTDQFYSFTITGPRNLVAHFSGDFYTINVDASPAEGGQVSGGGDYFFGEAVSVAAAANPGFVFLRWLDGDGNQVSVQNPYVFTANDDRDLTAHFFAIPTKKDLLAKDGQVTITVEVEPEGVGTYEYTAPELLPPGEYTFDVGETITLVALPNAGVDFTGWFDDENGLITSTLSYTFTAAEDRTISVVFGADAYDVTVEANPEAGGSVDGGGTYLEGLFATVTAEANPGYVFKNWTKNGVQVSVNAVYGFTVNEDVDLVANFDPIDTHTVALAADPVEGGSVDGGGSFLAGTEITITATADVAAGYEFVQWNRITGVDESEFFAANAMHTFTVTDDLELEAEFELRAYDITVSADPADKGNVIGGGEEITHGTSVTLQAVATATGYEFKYWMEDDTPIDGIGSTYEFTAIEDRDIVAVFGLRNYTITAAAVPVSGGSVSLLVNGDATDMPATVSHFDQITVIADPETGYEFNYWSIAGGAPIAGAGETYVFTATANRSLNANFEKIKFNIVATASEGASIVAVDNVIDPVTGIVEVAWGDDQEFDIVIEPGYCFDVEVDGISVGAVGEYIFEDVTQGHTIEVITAARPVIALGIGEDAIGSGHIENVTYGDDVAIVINNVQAGQYPFTISYTINNDPDHPLSQTDVVINEGDAIFPPAGVELDAGSYVFRITVLEYEENGLVCSAASVGAYNATINVAAKTLEVTAEEGQSKVYGSADPAFTYDVDGFVYDDDESIITGALSRVAGEFVGNYAITKGSLAAGNNYVIDFTSNDFEILQLAITVAADEGQNKVYGEGDPVFTYDADDLAFSDLFVGALSREPGEHVGAYDILIGSLIVEGVTGADVSANYNITFESAEFEITPLAITVAADAGQSKVYGDADPVFTYTSDALAFDDVFAGALVREPGEHVNDYEIQIGTLTIEDAAGDEVIGNYVLNYVPADFAITPLAITVAADAGQGKVYGDADPVFTYTSDALAFDDVFAGALVREPGEHVNDYEIQIGTLTIEDAAGVEVIGNYVLNYVPADFAITPLAITVTADAGQGKVYGEADPEFEYTADALAFDDVFAGALDREPGEDVGVYEIQIGTLTIEDAAGIEVIGNYVLNYVPANFAITAKELTIGGSFTAEDKVHDGTADATIDEDNLTLVGVEPGDVVVLTDVVVEFAQADIGNDISVSIVDADIDGADAGNYTLSLVGAPQATADILGTVVVTVEPADAGEVTGEGAYRAGAEVTLVATANEGWVFDSWKEDGVVIPDAGATYIFTMPAAHVELTAVFEEEPDPVDPENIMIIHDITADAGDVITVELEIQNDEEFVGFNLHVPLPAGFSYVEGSAMLADDRITDHDFGFNVDDNTAIIIAFSATNAAFLGNDGVIFSFDLQSSVLPGEYPLPIENAVIGNIEGEDILTATVPGTITLEGVMPDAYTVTLEANPVEGGTVDGEGEYFVGTDVTVTATANEGYAFISWTDEGDVVVSIADVYTFTMPDEDVTLTANFELIDYTLTLIANPVDGGTVTGAGVYNFGDEVEVDAIPNDGWAFVNWTDENDAVVSEEAFNVITITGDLTLTANFEMIDYTLTLIANPEDGGTVTGAGVYNYGDEVEVDAIPNEGWEFISWTDEEDNFVSDDAFNVITITGDLTLTANFEMIDYTLTLIASPEDGGTVTGAGVYNFGDEVEVNAIPNEGWEFVNWTDEDDAVVSDEALNVITITGDLTLTANFEMIDYTLTLIANPTAGGTVTGAGVYNFGDEAEVNAIPNDGWEFVNWTDVDGNVVSDQALNVITITGDLTLTANFELITYTVTFVVTDSDGATIADAIITFDGVEYLPGDYVFDDLLPGSYDYMVSRDGFFSKEGTVTVVDADVTVNVTLEIDDTSVPVVEVLEISVFPNPVSSVLNIESNLLITDVRMIDMLGQVVYNVSVDDQYHSINVSSLRNGVYFVQIHTLGGVITQRIQVAH